MKSILLYYSQFGNTRQLAEAMAQALNTTALEFTTLEPSMIQDAEVIIMGVPTHAAALPQPVKEKFEQLPKDLFKGKKVAAYDTAYKMGWFVDKFTAGGSLLAKMRQCGGKPLGKATNFYVAAKEGPLLDGEMERAIAWVKQLVK